MSGGEPPPYLPHDHPPPRKKEGESHLSCSRADRKGRPATATAAGEVALCKGSSQRVTALGPRPGAAGTAEVSRGDIDTRGVTRMQAGASRESTGSRKLTQINQRAVWSPPRTWGVDVSLTLDFASCLKEMSRRLLFLRKNTRDFLGLHGLESHAAKPPGYKPDGR